MNFLNPIFLLAFLAVAVPLLIHIFTRRRVPEILFSTLRFIRRSDRRSMRRINLSRLLLLLLRMAGVALVAMAFARPVLRGGLAAIFPTGGSRAACVLVDRSYSMGVEEDEGTLFERGKSRLGHVLGNLDSDDEVSVVLFDTAQETVYRGERLEVEAVLESMKGALPSWGGTDLRSAVREGQRILGESRREVKELYIISDFQRSAFGRRAEVQERSEMDMAEGINGAGEGAGKGGRAGPPLVRTFILPVQPEEGANVAIVSVFVPRVPLHRGEIAEIKTILKNTSARLPSRFPLEILVDGNRIMEKEIELPPGGVGEEGLSFPVERMGWISGEVRKRTDRLSADDRRFFTLHVREKMRVLLVADEAGFYLKQALNPDQAEGDISLESRSWRGFTTDDLEEAEALVLGPGRGPMGRDIGLFEHFVDSGGRALILVLPELEDVVIRLSRFSPRIDFRVMEDGFISVARPQSPPKFLSPFEREDLSALSRLKFKRAAFVKGIPDRAVLLEFKSGTPFMWEERRGGGTMIFAALEPLPQAGELPLSPHFLPLIQQAVLATGPEPVVGEGSLVGNPIAWDGSFGEDPICRLPGGSELKPEVRKGKSPLGFEVEGGRTGGISGTGTGDLVIPPVEQPGFVTIYEGEVVVGQVAVNLDCSAESDLSVMDGEEAADSLGLENHLVVEEGSELAASVYYAREGREISMPLALAAVAVFMLELFVAQREKGETSG